MVESVRECTRQGVAAYPGRPRAQWVLEWPGQVVLVTTAVFWTSEVAKVGVVRWLLHPSTCMYGPICSKEVFQQSCLRLPAFLTHCMLS
jgi:hypothetical protein